METSNAAIWSNLSSNATRITNLETSIIISNSSTITTGFSKGDLIYASLDNILSKLPISSIEGYVLTTNASSGLPEWRVPSGGGTIDNYTTNGTNTGISNTSPVHTLHVGSNVIIDDIGADVMYVRGNVYATNDIISSRNMYTNRVFTRQLFIKNTSVIAERPTRIVKLT